ncbi:hypothetical protein DPMN_094467 [Dreissena polymorpha]|uniref:Uncharacterized protein n=1 Tax=Dreissena polymorpha TaxID=45954 RepID=A0A9D4L553_DREPO|nr:hypothetical protein DPMN_094467 [Dreissena polymorpha]
MAASKVDDVRPVLQYYNQFEDPIDQFHKNQAKLRVCYVLEVFLCPRIKDRGYIVLGLSVIVCVCVSQNFNQNF